MRIAITSGYFDPIHLGHIELLERSRAGEKIDSSSSILRRAGMGA